MEMPAEFKLNGHFFGEALGSAVIHHDGLRPIATQSVFASPRAVRSLVCDLGVATFKMLALSRGLGRLERLLMCRKWFRPDVIKSVGVTPVMLSDVIGDLQRGSPRIRRSGGARLCF